MFSWGFPVPPKKPNADPEPVQITEADEDLTARLRGFDELGFEPWVAFVLAWRDVSPADVRERLLKRGATHEQVARIFT